MDSIKKNITGNMFCGKLTRELMQSGIIKAPTQSEKFNSFISSWGDINISDAR